MSRNWLAGILVLAGLQIVVLFLPLSYTAIFDPNPTYWEYVLESSTFQTGFERSVRALWPLPFLLVAGFSWTATRKRPRKELPADQGAKTGSLKFSWRLIAGPAILMTVAVICHLTDVFPSQGAFFVFFAQGATMLYLVVFFIALMVHTLHRLSARAAPPPNQASGR